MGYKLNALTMDGILDALSKEYRVFAPKWDKAKKNVRFSPIRSVSEIVTDRQSDFSTKEAYYPISQVMMYFRSDTVEEEQLADERKILIIARPCDINAIRRLDTIFLENGNPDFYYARMRKLVFFALLECKESFENCFCVSMGSNQTDDYCMAFRFEKKDDGTAGDTYVEIKDPAFASYFESACGNDTVIDFKPEFVKENKKVMHAPNISRANLKAISDMEYWTQFDERCIGCGGCNTVCGTCSCFDTSDIIYEEGKPDGERRRVWSSCMIPNFTETAGGARSRKTQGANMRFKVFHKFYDFAARFGKENMCVGCGRCDMRCPRQISFFDTVNDLTKEIEKLEK